MKALSLATPHAVIMVGIAGSGKTFFAQKFSLTFAAPLLSYDDFYAATQDTEKADALYGSVLNEIAKTKQSVVLEVDTHTRTNRTALARHLRGLGYEPLFVWVQTDRATAKRRNMRDNRDDSLFDEDLRRFSAPHDTERAVVISGKHTYATQARAVLQRMVSERPVPIPRAAPRRSNVKIQ